MASMRSAAFIQVEVASRYARAGRIGSALPGTNARIRQSDAVHACASSSFTVPSGVVAADAVGRGGWTKAGQQKIGSMGVNIPKAVTRHGYT